MALPVMLRLPEVAEALGVSKDTVLCWTRKGTFPTGRKLGPGVRAWTEDEISQWINSRPAPEPRKNTAASGDAETLVA